MCLTFKQWSSILPDDTILVLIYRHPAEVVNSLEVRDNVKKSLGLDLWMKYVGDALDLTYNSKFRDRRVLVSHYELSNNPKKALRKLREDVRELGGCLHMITDKEIDGFVSIDLYHNRQVDSNKNSELSNDDLDEHKPHFPDWLPHDHRVIYTLLQEGNAIKIDPNDFLPNKFKRFKTYKPKK